MGTDQASQAARQPHAALPGVERHPHAAAVLTGALAPGGRPSHAYLFHGPAGSGKRELAGAFAAALLAGGASDSGQTLERVRRGTHPDLTWVRPSGAAEMLVSDIDEAVVAAATRTPFESSRRVFVLEGVETLNDQAANRLLKTLEEPPSFVHLLLISDRPGDVLATIVSRCQLVRFDPLGADLIEAALADAAPQTARAGARLAAGDGVLARRLVEAEGRELRALAEAYARAILRGVGTDRPWEGLLAASRAAGTQAGELAERSLAAELELLPAKERKRQEREGLDARRRSERRARTATLDLGLRLTELWLRDVLCVLEGAQELIFAVDRQAQLESDAAVVGEGQVSEAIELVGATRLSLALNVGEELALESLAYSAVAYA